MSTATSSRPTFSSPKRGQVKLLDFGIAKLLEDETGMAAATILTREGERALTLAYAAPEQVSGNAVTTGTDVYALGVLLYLLLAGKHPAEAALQSPADLMKAIVDTEPPRASASVGPTHKLSRVLRGDLDTIVAKALKKNPAERYVLVTVFAEDLRRYLGHQVISARPDTLAYRARKFVRRNQMAVALAAAASVAMVSGVVSTVIQARNARIERDFALRQLSRAESINDLNSFVLSDAAPSGKPFSVNDLLTRAEELVGRQKGGDEVNRIELLVSIGSQYISHNEYTQARRVLEQAYALARALPQGPTRARTSCALADSLVLDSDRERAEQLVQEGLSELPRDARFALDRVFCLRRASDVAFRGGQFQEAIARAEGAQRALSEMPFRAEVSELDNLIVLANLYLHGGRVREASALFEEVSARLTSLGRDKTQRTGDLFTNWGLALSIWGRPLDAERFLRQAIALGQDNQTEGAVLPSVLLYYAQALKELGKFDEASDYAGRAGTKAQAAGMPGVLVQSLLVRSAVHRHQGDLERANQMVSDAESVLQSNSPARAKSIATLSQRALIAQARGDMQTALELATEAVTTAEAAKKQGRAVSDELQGLLVNRSAIQLQLGHPDDAAEDARRALKMSPHAAEPAVFSSTVGRAQVALGRALQAQERREEARSAFRSALEHLQSALGPDHAETRAARQLVDRQIPL